MASFHSQTTPILSLLKKQHTSNLHLKDSSNISGSRGDIWPINAKYSQVTTTADQYFDISLKNWLLAKTKKKYKGNFRSEKHKIIF